MLYFLHECLGMSQKLPESLHLSRMSFHRRQTFGNVQLNNQLHHFHIQPGHIGRGFAHTQLQNTLHRGRHPVHGKYLFLHRVIIQQYLLRFFGKRRQHIKNILFILRHLDAQPVINRQQFIGSRLIFCFQRGKIPIEISIKLLSNLKQLHKILFQIAPGLFIKIRTGVDGRCRIFLRESRRNNSRQYRRIPILFHISQYGIHILLPHQILQQGERGIVVLYHLIRLFHFRSRIFFGSFPLNTATASSQHKSNRKCSHKH